MDELGQGGFAAGADVYSVWTATPASRATSAIVVSAQPFLIINSRLAGIVAMALVSVLSWRRGWLLFGINSAALILVILTLTALEPLNRIADAWNPDQLPADRQESRRRWFNLHLIRTALALAAFACLITTRALDRGSDPAARVDQAVSPGVGS
ncbi:anthrone oxygenase family protein [Nonomuraea jabiensis]|uniref:DUF1772 domain-containing protein n=1 Tax=Nonomuraea jabiensis TaxID=882448 RepID=A0A7W9GFX2_9ACTN|nr:anthrone oxygenase family protein [Nonomuraea jabiensis]MBB5783092.1 hypothetical protein [Nonomuraea jabiensis]